MNKDITIVTAFFDIGRGTWTQDRGFPHYLLRSNDTYFERFAHLASLENEMFIFTSAEHVDRVAALRGDQPTTIFQFDYKEQFAKLLEEIEWVQIQPNYQGIINNRERINPEYWNPEYVLINVLKSTFACMASIQAKNDMLAWVDFGYCREAATLNNVKHWRYPFDPERIHFFSIRDWDNRTLPDVIGNNRVYITGPCIVASKALWKDLEFYVFEALSGLLENSLVDDDQTLLLLTALAKPELCQIHKVDPSDWFVIFKKFNEDIS